MDEYFAIKARKGGAYRILLRRSSCGDLYTIGLDSARNGLHIMDKQQKRTTGRDHIRSKHLVLDSPTPVSYSCRWYWRRPPIADLVSLAPLRNGVVICDCRNALGAWPGPLTARIPMNHCPHPRWRRQWTRQPHNYLGLTVGIAGPTLSPTSEAIRPCSCFKAGHRSFIHACVMVPCRRWCKTLSPFVRLIWRWPTPTSSLCSTLWKQKWQSWFTRVTKQRGQSQRIWQAFKLWYWYISSSSLTGTYGKGLLLSRMRSFLWTDQLHMRTKIELVASNSPVWPSWIFAESLRRTILMSHLFRGLYSCLKLGFCNNVVSLTPLLFTARASQWDNPVGNTLKCVDQSQSPPVVSYYDFVLMSDKRRPVQAEAFERLLLVACKGEECIDILEPDMLFQEVNR